MDDEKRTKKNFKPYNEYYDRGMSLKWGTAFELGELTRSIDKGKKESNHSIERLPQMTEQEIDCCFEESLTKNKVLEVQLNSLDELGRTKNHVFGQFMGFVDSETILINDTFIAYQDIRNIQLHDFKKWNKS